MSDPQNKVPFPLAGNGAHLRYRTADYVDLRKKYGEPKIVQRPALGTGFPEEVWQTFVNRIDDGLGVTDPIVIVDCLKAGLKLEDGRTPWSEIDYSDLSFPLIAAVPAIRNAMVLAVTNEPYAKLLDRQREAAELAERNKRLRERGVEFNGEAPDDADPSLTLTTSTLSGESSGSDTPPAS